MFSFTTILLQVTVHVLFLPGIGILYYLYPIAISVEVYVGVLSSACVLS